MSPTGTAQGDESPSPSIGAYLARQRRLRGIELDDLVKLTHIPRRSLERLEGGAFDGVTDGFVRGFVRTVAIAIGLDPDEAVMRMLAEPVARPGRSLPPVGLLVGIAAVAALLIATGAFVAGRASRPVAAVIAPPPDERVVLRLDAVRALAREHGLLDAAPAEAAPPDAILPGSETILPGSGAGFDTILPGSGAGTEGVLPGSGAGFDAIVPGGVAPPAPAPIAPGGDVEATPEAPR